MRFSELKARAISLAVVKGFDHIADGLKASNKQNELKGWIWALYYRLPKLTQEQDDDPDFVIPPSLSEAIFLTVAVDELDNVIYIEYATPAPTTSTAGQPARSE